MNSIKSNQKNRQRGLSLVETMIAMALSLVILAGVFQIYTGNKRTYTMQDELARLQENARFALETISKDIRSAGYNGCLRSDLSPINFVVDTINAATFDPASGIQGWEAVNTAPTDPVVIDASGKDKVVDTDGADAFWSIGGGPSGLGNVSTLPGSDIIRVWYASNDAENLDAVTAHSKDPITEAVTNASITLSGNGIGIQAGDVMVLSDCGRIDYVMACTTPSIGTHIVELENTCGALRGNDLDNKFLSVDASNTLVRKLKSAIYYVGKMDDATKNPPALYKKQLGADTLASDGAMIVEGVENIQLLYGEDTSGNNVVDQYHTAATVTNWNNIINVKVSLLMSTQAKVGTPGAAEQTYDLNGVLITPTTPDDTPPDNRLRRVFSTTVTLRNRV